MPENETRSPKGSSGEKKTAHVLRKQLGKVSSAMVSQHQEYNQIRKKIIEAFSQGSQTVPEIAEATNLPGHQILWHLMAMKKYGKLNEGQEKDGYYEYALNEKQEK